MGNLESPGAGQGDHKIGRTLTPGFQFRYSACGGASLGDSMPNVCTAAKSLNRDELMRADNRRL